MSYSAQPPTDGPSPNDPPGPTGPAWQGGPAQPAWPGAPAAPGMPSALPASSEHPAPPALGMPSALPASSEHPAPPALGMPSAPPASTEHPAPPAPGGSSGPGMPGPIPPAARPGAVTTAVALLWTMAVAGFVYAMGMLAVTPGTIGRFRDAAAGSEVAENFVAVVWLDSAVGAVVALLIVALFVVLGLGLRRGSQVARGVTLAVCVLGVLAGCGSVAAIGAQQSGDAVQGSLGEALNQAYPSGWIGFNAAVAVAQIVAYILVAFLLLLAPRAFFGRGPVSAATTPPAPAPAAPAWTPHPGGPSGGMPPAGLGYVNPPVYAPSEPAVTTSPWAAPHSADQYRQSDQSPSEGDQNAVHPPTQKPAPRPEDEYWSRPSE